MTASSLRKSLFRDNPIFPKPTPKYLSGAWNALTRDDPELIEFAEDMYSKGGLQKETTWIMERIIDEVVRGNSSIPNTEWWGTPRSIDERVDANIDLFYCQKYASIVASQCGEGNLGYNVDCLKNHDKLSARITKRMPKDVYWKGLATLTIVSPWISSGGGSIFYDLDCSHFIEWSGARDDTPEVVRVARERGHLDVGGLQAIIEDGGRTPASLRDGLV
jgi:hypothetical protein